MTAREFYDKIDGNFDEALERLVDESFMVEFADMFLQDENYKGLIDAIEAGDAQAAFAASHAFKGVCTNLAYTKIGNLMVDITNALRDGDVEPAIPMLPTLVAYYEEIEAAIAEFKS